MPNPSVKLGALDLNLLVVFDAVMQERNVNDPIKEGSRRLMLDEQPSLPWIGRLIASFRSIHVSTQFLIGS